MPSEFTLNTRLYLMSKRELWLSDGSMGFGEESDVVFSEGMSTTTLAQETSTTIKSNILTCILSGAAFSHPPPIVFMDGSTQSPLLLLADGVIRILSNTVTFSGTLSFSSSSIRVSDFWSRDGGSVGKPRLLCPVPDREGVPVRRGGWIRAKVPPE